MGSSFTESKTGETLCARVGERGGSKWCCEDDGDVVDVIVCVVLDLELDWNGD